MGRKARRLPVVILENRLHVDLSRLLSNARKLAAVQRLARSLGWRWIAWRAIAGVRGSVLAVVIGDVGRRRWLLACRRLQSLALLTRHLSGICPPKALELQVFADGVFEQSHCAGKPYCARPLPLSLYTSIAVRKTPDRARTGL